MHAVSGKFEKMSNSGWVVAFKSPPNRLAAQTFVGEIGGYRTVLDKRKLQLNFRCENILS